MQHILNAGMFRSWIIFLYSNLVFVIAAPYRYSTVTLNGFLSFCPILSIIAGHRHRVRCRRHRHSGILYLIPVPEHSGTGLGPLTPVPDWVPLLRYRTGSASELLFIPVPNWLHAGQSDIPAFKKDVGGGGERETQCTSKLLVVESNTPCTSTNSCWWCYSCNMYDIENSYDICKCWNAGVMLIRHWHFFRYSAASVRHQHSGIGVRYRWSRINPALLSYVVYKDKGLRFYRGKPRFANPATL